MAVDNAATLEWRVYAAACAEVLGFGAKRLNDLHKAVLENFRQLSAWAIEDGVDVALERFCRCARDAYKTDVQVEDIPDAQALHQQQRQTRQALDGLAERAWMVEASRKRVGCLPLAPAEVEKRIQTVLQAPAMPESWERRRGEMTLKEAMGYRGENADTLAEKIGIRAGEVRRWMGENGMLRISGARMQQLAAALDGGVLVTADGAEVELYGNGGNA